jgi:polyhydroxyalkanoate synthase
VRNLATLWTRPPPRLAQTPADTVHRENKWRLLRYRARTGGAAYATPIVVVPSLINRYSVLDLQPGRSLVEYLVAQGHDVYLVDWGTPGDEDRHLTFDEVCDRYLGRAVRHAARGSPRGKAHLLGYCMGGTLAAIHAAARPAHVASLATLASPIGFHDEGLLSVWTRTRAFDVDALVRGFGNVPWPLMQAAFHLLRPTGTLAKAVTLVERAWDDEYLDGFLASEAWGADNVSMPGAFYARYIDALYRGDALLQDAFSLSGRPVRLSDIRCPTLAVTCEQDHIVPWRSAAVLLERVGAADTLHLPQRGGHVGAVVSRQASRVLWPSLSRWWAERDREA